MRAAAACLVLSLLGCSSSDPDLHNVCGQRRPAKVELGTGQYKFILLGQQGGPLIETDLQQGDFLWFAVGTQGLGPSVQIDFGVQTDLLLLEQGRRSMSPGVALDGGFPLSVPSGQVPEVLTYDSSLDLDVWPGLQAFFQLPVQGINNTAQLVNQTVILWASVTDRCYQTPVEAAIPTTIAGFDTSSCVGCLAQACAPQLAACDQDCFRIQACLDTYCINLSTIASPDEVACQAWCQSQYSAAKNAHVALVGCVQSSMCQPPCAGYSIDYRHCTSLEDAPPGSDAPAGPCYDKAMACTGGDCLAYKNCINACTTWASCQVCRQQHPVGVVQFEDHQRCLYPACFLQGWLPHM
jgi:hypothetical protein